MTCAVCNNLLPNIQPVAGEHGVTNKSLNIDMSAIQSSAQACQYCQVLGSAISAASAADRDGFYTNYSISPTVSTFLNAKSEVPRSIGIQVEIWSKCGFDKILEFYNIAGMSPIYQSTGV
jgi:hypothetical protein